jgi:hypothetical protein
MERAEKLARFLNVDLDIYSRSNLQPLVSALGKRVLVLHVGRIKRAYCAHLELNKLAKDPDSVIRCFCSLLQSLQGAPRKLWNGATVRAFNIGVQAEAEPFAYEIALSNATLSAASEIGARIVVTIYAPEKQHDPPPPQKALRKKRSSSPRSGSTSRSL